MKIATVFAGMALTLSTSALAQAGWPNLTRYDQCIGAQVRRHVPAGRSIASGLARGIASAAVTSCEALLPPAVSDYKRLTLSLVRNTPYAAQAANASDDQWREKLVTLRVSMARGLVAIASAQPPAMDH